MAVIYIIMAALGLVLGSFAGATVWRLRARQLADEDKLFDRLKAHKAQLSAEEVADLEYLKETKKERSSEQKRLNPISGASLADDRSKCLKCGHTLAWYDLLPIISWLSIKGRCRYCKKRIGWYEPLVEVGTAAVFVCLTYAWTTMYGLGQLPVLAIWVVVAVMMIILFIYDSKWFILPDRIVLPLVAVGTVATVVSVTSAPDVMTAVISVIGSVLLLGGLYWALYTASKGTWVGFGDVKLGIALGLLLADWRLAFLALFIANLAGTLLVVPGLLTKKLTRRSHVPFGPLLIVGFAVAFLAGEWIIATYERLSLEILF